MHSSDILCTSDRAAMCMTKEPFITGDTSAVRAESYLCQAVLHSAPTQSELDTICLVNANTIDNESLRSKQQYCTGI